MSNGSRDLDKAITIAGQIRPRSQLDKRNARYSAEEGSRLARKASDHQKKLARLRRLADKEQAQKPLSEAEQEELDAFFGRSADPLEQEKRQLKLQAKALVKSQVLGAREDPNKFMEYCFQDSETGDYLTQQWFHREFQDAMADRSITDLGALMPRDHGKTTQIEGHIIWKLGNNPNLRIKIVCESDNKAVERLFAIIQHLRINDRVRSVFPWLKPAKLGDWTKHKIVVERDRIMRDASVEALGVLSTATGGRSDESYYDDICGRRNSLEQPKLRETVKSAYDSDWSNLLEPTGKTIYVNTPWHKSDCTHEKVLPNPEYHIIQYPIGTSSDPFEPIWESKWPRHLLEKRQRKIGKLEMDRGFRLKALSGEYVVIRPEWIQYWETPPDVDALQIFIAFDESSGEGKDFFACTVVGYNPSTFKVYILDSWHGKLTFLRRAEAVEKQSKRWRANVTGVEQSNLKSLTQYLDETTILSVVPLKPTISKRLRLHGVEPLVERGDVIWNPALKPENRKDQERGDPVTQLLDFPLAANDDMVDTFVYAINLAQIYGGIEDEEAGSVPFNVETIGGNGNGKPLMESLFDVGETDSGLSVVTRRNGVR
jgi:phage terminase large subunit-like protein